MPMNIIFAYPEGDYIVSGDKNVRRVEGLQILRVVRPAEGGKRPQRRREPCVKHVAFLSDVRASAVGTGRDVGFGDGDFSAVAAVKCGNSVSPPELTGDAPVVDVLHPVEVYLAESFGDEADLSFLHDLYGGAGEGLHFHEPLL